tara:strand:+ start:175 stop:411 length:237 start_codon:yes stop_codon:yes gene_type:complete
MKKSKKDKKHERVLKTVEVFSNHYVERFKFLLEGEMLNLQVKRHKDANSIMQEYLCNDGEAENDDYKWLYLDYLNKKK